ncbi:unnamed protein product [Absidia cylindrospora]
MLTDARRALLTFEAGGFFFSLALFPTPIWKTSDKFYESTAITIDLPSEYISGARTSFSSISSSLQKNLGEKHTSGPNDEPRDGAPVQNSLQDGSRSTITIDKATQGDGQEA